MSLNTLAAQVFSNSPSMLDHHGSEARHIAGAWWLIFAMAAVVYAVVAGLVIAAIVRHRPQTSNGKTPNDLVTTDAAGNSIEAGDTRWIWIGGLIVPVLP